ncbi:MAG TPA: hypothetical protein VK983_02655 [Candidatus Limnocylindrales bacterium]|nr:hypothetical protein [Candidatus Limnocylindrales bacterium]
MDYEEILDLMQTEEGRAELEEYIRPSKRRQPGAYLPGYAYDANQNVLNPTDEERDSLEPSTEAIELSGLKKAINWFRES